MTFAKMFNTQHGQVVAMIQANDDGAPEVRFFCKPDGLDVSSVAFSYPDSDEGWSRAEDGFAKVDIELAEKAYRSVTGALCND